MVLSHSFGLTLSQTHMHALKYTIENMADRSLTDTRTHTDPHMHNSMQVFPMTSQMLFSEADI